MLHLAKDESPSFLEARVPTRHVIPYQTIRKRLYIRYPWLLAPEASARSVKPSAALSSEETRQLLRHADGKQS
jgi:hypothetical protein